MIVTALKTKVMGYVAGGMTIGMVVMLIYIAVLRGQLSDANAVITKLTTWQNNMVAAIGLASGNKDVTKDTAQLQLQALGDSISDLKDSVQRGNLKVEQMAKDLEAAKARAVAEGKKRETAIKNAERARDVLLKAEPDADIRALQDQAYEAGL